MERFWTVKIGFYKCGDTYCESSVEVRYEDAASALEAIRVGARWREWPDPSTWTSVEVQLSTYEPRTYARDGKHPD